MSEIKKEFRESEISISNIINFYISNTGNIILYALVPFLLALAIMAFFGQFIFGQKNIFYGNILVRDELLSDVSETFLFNPTHISNALEKSKLSDKVNVNSEFIQSFNIISGHTDYNELVDSFLTRDTLSLTKQLYFKPEQVENLRKDLVSKGNSFKIITFSNSNTNLSVAEKSILISNLVSEINKSLQIRYDFSNINLKKIGLLELNNPISIMDITKINSRLALIRNYIYILEESYSSFAPGINLSVYLNDLKINEDLFNYMIQKKPAYKEIIAQRLELDILALNKNIIALKENIGTFETGAIGMPTNQSADALINADSTFIDTILNLGDKINSSDLRQTYLDEIYSYEQTKISIERRLEDLALSSDFEFNSDKAEEYLIKSLNETTQTLNEYIDIVKGIKQNIEVFTLLSVAQSEQSLLSPMLRQILYILIGSLSLSFFIISIKLLRNNNTNI